MIVRHLRAAARGMRNNKLVTTINIAGLSIGMTAALLILLWVRNETSYDSAYADAEAIYRITNHLAVNKTDSWIWESSPYALGSVAETDVPGIAAVGRLFTGNRPILRSGSKIFMERHIGYVDSGFMTMLPAQMIAGDAAAFMRHPNSMILTASTAKKYFGDDNPIGKNIRIDSIEYEVRAIMKDPALNSSFNYDLLLPFKKGNDDPWGDYTVMTFVKLTPNASPAKVAANLAAAANRQAKKGKFTISLTPLTAMHFETEVQHSQFVHTDKRSVYIFAILAGIILVIACINYVNLTTARAGLRAREIGVRKIIGAGRTQLFGQFIVESMLISTISLIVSLALTWLTLPLLRALTEQQFTLQLSSPMIWQLMGGTLVATIILNGIYPAIMLSSFDPLKALKGSVLMRLSDVLFRKGLVIAQFTIAVVLIIGTIIADGQLQFIQHSSGDYDRAQILEMQMPVSLFLTDPNPRDRIDAATKTFRADLQTHSSFTAVVYANQSIVELTSQSGGGFYWEGKPNDVNLSFTRLAVGPGFDKMFNIRMVEGRWIHPEDPADRHNFVLNETAIKEMHIRTPAVGRRFIHGSDTGIIAGVVKDFAFANMREKIAPLMVEPAFASISIFARVAPGRTTAAIADASAVWNKLLPGSNFEYHFMDADFEKLYSSDRKLSRLVGIFSGIAIFISALGLFGLTAFSVQQRTREIGIRKVLGASVGHVIQLLSAGFLRLVGISILVAAPVAWWLSHRWLQDFAYRIEIRPWMFLLAGTLATLVAAITISLQAGKAALANPAKSLRTE